MLSLSLNFMLGIFVIFFVIIGFSFAETPLAECGLGCARKTTADGRQYGYMVYDELVVFGSDINKNILFHCHGYGQDCDFANTDPRWMFDHYFYKNDERRRFHYVDYNGKMGNINQNDWILKYEVAVMEPKYFLEYVFAMDITAFGLPAFAFYLNNQQSIKVLISAGNLNTHGLYGVGPYVLFSDPEDKCRQYRPTSVTLTNFMNMNLYINVKYGKNAYYFIKKDNFICGYEIEHSHLFQFVSAYQKAPEIRRVNNYLIDTYPTINYAPNFFCIDALYGAFVSLYWDQQPSSPPEAHFYEINEINLNNIKMVHKVILTNFDDNVLGRIFANNFDAEYQPVFQSYGGQVFVWFKLPKHDVTINWWDYENKAWHGLWKNETEYDVQYQDIDNRDSVKLKFINPNRLLFRAKKSWITKDRPIGADSSPQSPTEQEQPPPDQQHPPAPKTEAPKTDPPTTEAPKTDPPKTEAPKTDAPTTEAPKTDPPKTEAPKTDAPTTEAPLPPTTTEPVTVPPIPATSAPKTTTLQPRIPSTALPPTNPTSSPKEPTTVPQPQNPLNATSTSAPSNAPSGSTIPGSSNSSSETASNGTNNIYTPPTPQHLKDKSNGNDDENCSFSKNLPWIFILLIIIDVVEVIILAGLVFLKFRGAKKMREAMAKKKALKSVKKDKKKKKPSTESKQSMPMKKPMSEKKKKQKKSIKEKSVTKTEEVGKTTASEAPKTSTVDQTNYYTINQSFKK